MGRGMGMRRGLKGNLNAWTDDSNEIGILILFVMNGLRDEEVKSD